MFIRVKSDNLNLVMNLLHSKLNVFILYFHVFYFSWFNIGAYKARCRTLNIDKSDILDPSPQTHAVGERMCYSQSQLPHL